MVPTLWRIPWVSPSATLIGLHSLPRRQVWLPIFANYCKLPHCAPCAAALLLSWHWCRSKRLDASVATDGRKMLYATSLSRFVTEPLSIAGLENYSAVVEHMQFFSTATSIPPTTLSATTIQYLSNQIIQYAAQVRHGKPCNSQCTRSVVTLRSVGNMSGFPDGPTHLRAAYRRPQTGWVHLQKGTEANGIIIHWVNEAGRPDSTNVTSVATSYILSRVEVRSCISFCTEFDRHRSQHLHAQHALTFLGVSVFPGTKADTVLAQLRGYNLLPLRYDKQLLFLESVHNIWL